MTSIIQYLKDDVLPEDKRKVRLLKLNVGHYTMYDDQLYKREFSTPLLKCVDLEERNYILQKITRRSVATTLGGSPWHTRP